MPLMPFIHETMLYGSAGLGALVLWKGAPRLAGRLPDLKKPWAGVRRTAVAGVVPQAWYRTSVRSSGNSAFDDWRDGELARLEAERAALEARLVAFEAFVDGIKRAKDRATFDRFVASFRDGDAGDADLRAE